jgi:Dna[CI] antecedent, DciA
MTPRKFHMQPAASGLDKVVARFLRKAPPEEAPLLAWPVACGSTVAARTRALEFEDGILRVQVPDAGWRRELQALAPRYVAALNGYLKDAVTKVEFVVAGRKHAASVAGSKNARRKRA